MTYHIQGSPVNLARNRPEILLRNENINLAFLWAKIQIRVIYFNTLEKIYVGYTSENHRMSGDFQNMIVICVVSERSFFRSS